ncbi:MAG: glycosyltransferase family 4 protein, partial [Candidatus Woesebacteria bacterium]|nr:glycosyltransferase family 4 protein [Candidatus Woesebacteria bacterium]
LWIVGTHMNTEIKNLASGDIEVTEGLKDIRDAYKNASVLVAPIKGPGGTRLKILEAMASALPVVTTSVGAEGLGVSDNNEALIRDSLDSLADAAISILKDSNLAYRLGKSGKDFVEKNYTWDESADKLDKIYKEVYGG